MTEVEPAYDTHEDGQEPGVEVRLSGLMELGGDTPTLKQLKKACKDDAENGRDPFAQGTVEVGLLLSENEYLALVEYAKGLKVVYGRRRKNARA